MKNRFTSYNMFAHLADFAFLLCCIGKGLHLQAFFFFNNSIDLCVGNMTFLILRGKGGVCVGAWLVIF